MVGESNRHPHLQLIVQFVLFNGTISKFLKFSELREISNIFLKFIVLGIVLMVCVHFTHVVALATHNTI